MEAPPPPPPPPPPTKRILEPHELDDRRREEKYTTQVSIEYARGGCELPTMLKVLGSNPSIKSCRPSETPDIYWLDYAHITSTNRELVTHEAKFDTTVHRNGIPQPEEWGLGRMVYRTRNQEKRPLAAGATMSAQAQVVKSLHANQAVNYFVGMANVCNKANLASFVAAYEAAHPQKRPLAPVSWTLPLQSDSFRTMIDSDPSLADQVFIVKPEVGSKAHGITFYRGGDILDAFESGALATGDPRGRNRIVVQHYINNPLLINRKKWDLRVYLLISNLHPYRAYLYHDGLARFCANEYVPLQPIASAKETEAKCSTDSGDAAATPEAGATTTRRRRRRSLDTKYFFTHITNYAVNRKSENFDMDECKRTANEALRQHFRENTAATNESDIEERVAGVWRDISRLCADTVRSIGPYLKLQYANCFLGSEASALITSRNPANNVGSSASPENWIAYTSANGWLLAPPAAARDEQAFELYNDKASMLPALPMLCPMSRDAMATRRDGHRAGYAAAWRWAKTGQFEASVQYSCFLDIVEEGSGQLIGTTGFRVIEQVSGEISAEWGIIVAAGWRRRHVCSESFNALLPLARSLWGCTKITANTLDSNSSMVAFLETRAGMQRTGHVHGNWVEFQRNTPDVHECATGDTNELQGQFGRSFQILGLDVMFDEDARPWLLEINSAPSLVLSRGSTTDRALKIPLLSSALRIAQAQNCGRDPTAEERGLFESVDFS